MKTYVSIFRIRFLNSLQYRAAALGGIATQYVWGFMNILALLAFYRAAPDAFPMSIPQTVSYIWMQQAFLALFMTWFFEMEIFDAISDGAIAYELVRPVDLYDRWFAQSAANRVAKAVLRCAPILLIAFFLPEPFRMTLPESGLSFLMFLLSAALALGVVVAFGMLIYISAFYTLNPLGVRIAAATLAEFFSGAMIPLPFFPQEFQAVVNFTPFAAMQNMPLRIYSGNIAGLDALYGVLLQVFWLAALILLGKRLMKNALKKVIVQGG